jgi:hypothetical protein
MQENKTVEEEDLEQESDDTTAEEPAEGAEHHIPGIEYTDEPDAENIMPAEDQPGTL